ncbi:hypothetical protein NMG60_11027304 [Bertholletia excelsa]
MLSPHLTGAGGWEPSIPGIKISVPRKPDPLDQFAHLLAGNMASKAVVSASTFVAKLLRHHVRPHSNPLAIASATFTGRIRRNFHHANPFLRSGELGPCRVEKTEDECLMRFDVPGVAREDMRVWAEPGLLHFYARDDSLPRYNYNGRVFGGSLSFNPETYDFDKVKTEVKNGVLWVSMPKLKHRVMSSKENIIYS